MRSRMRRRAATLLAMALIVLASAPAAALGDADRAGLGPTGFPEPSGDRRILPPGARLTPLFDGGCTLTEGPAAAQDGAIYFTDIEFSAVCRDEDGSPGGGIIWRYDPETGETAVFRSPSGQANGLDFDANGNLLAAEGADFGGRRVTRTDLDTGRAVVVAGLFQGRPFNSPNDITIDERGRVYFSDPRYNGLEPLEQAVQGVYRIDPDGSIERIIANASKPNGVLVSPDQQTLYVAVNDQGVEDEQRLTDRELNRIVNVEQALYAYDLRADGTVGARRKLVDYLPEAGPDGLEADVDGNLYVAVRDETAPGIYVYSPNGEELARIPTGSELPTNVGFGRGEDADLLYVTAGKSLYSIRLNKDGYQLPADG